MMIRGYAGQPMLYAPDPGEILYARRAACDAFTLAVVEKAWRNRAGFIRVRVMWLDSDPNASPGEKDRNDRDGRGESRAATIGCKTNPVAPYETGWLTLRHPLGESPLIMQINRDALPRKLVIGPGTAPSCEDSPSS